MKLKKLAVALAVAGLAVPGVASATNGYFAHGYGMKSKGMAGAATATASDAFGGAVNPAKMVWVGDRIDFGADLFSPRRESRRSGSGFGGFLDGNADSDSNYFLIPEFGYNKMVNPRLSLGVTVYGNGGMNTDYSGGEITSPAGTATCNFFQTGGLGPVQPGYNLLCGNGRLGVDLIQLVVAPTVAYKVNENHSIGISPLLGYQRFKMEGIEAFAGFSNDPANLTNRGHDNSTGWGVRVGWFGRFSDTVSVGAAYSSKLRMSTFDKYKGLFAENGDFDIPENWNVGVAFRPASSVTVALDYQRINYSDVKSVGNPSTNVLNCPAVGGADSSACLGGSNGAGFGWGDVDVFKIGVEYQYSKNLVLRAGYNHTDNPIQGRDVTFNILAPGVVQDHLTLGLTYTTASGGELTVGYMHAFDKSVTGSSLFNSFGLPGGNETIKMYQNSIGIAYGWKM
ncbi:MAG: outer membrane protein transport protein [Betaproteobacteria bacterium]|nr:outer membrane protein transport protein [Betaproteobacteria bacterium]